MPGGQICLICNCFQMFIIFQVVIIYFHIISKRTKSETILKMDILWLDHCHDMQMLSPKILDETFYYEIGAVLLNFVWIFFDCLSRRV